MHKDKVIKRINSAIQPWERLSAECSFANLPWFGVYRDTIRLPSGRIVDDYYRIELPEYVMIYAQKDDGKVLFQRQYKHALGAITLALPTGCLENGEIHIDGGKREFLDETGYVAHQWKFLGSFMVDGNKGCGKAHFYIVNHLEKRAEPLEDDMEESGIVFLEPELIFRAVLNGEISLLATATLIAIVSHPYISGRK